MAGFDPRNENCFQIIFMDSDGISLYDSGEVKFQMPDDQIRTSGGASMQFNIDIRNLILRKEGIHSTKVIFNGKELGNYRIEVIAGE